MTAPSKPRPIVNALVSTLAWLGAGLTAVSITGLCLLVLDGAGYGISPVWMDGLLLVGLPACVALIGLVLLTAVAIIAWKARRLGLASAFVCLPIVALQAYPHLLVLELSRFVTPGEPVSSPASLVAEIPPPWDWIAHEQRSITTDTFSGAGAHETLVVDRYQEAGSGGGDIVTIQMFREFTRSQFDPLLYVELREGLVYAFEPVCPISYGTFLGYHPTVVMDNFDFDPAREVFVNGADLGSPDNCTGIFFFDWVGGRLVSHFPDLGTAWLRLLIAISAPLLLIVLDRHWKSSFVLAIWVFSALVYAILYFNGMHSAWWLWLSVGVLGALGLLRLKDTLVHRAA